MTETHLFDKRKIKHLVLVSYDAFSEDNWEAAKALPNLASLIDSGTHCTQLKSVYPTLTYVVHSTTVTGVYPDRHGIVNNNPLQPFVPEDDQAWYWFRKDIKVPTIYDLLKKKGLDTAAILWPVTGKAGIRYNFPEIKAIGRENQIWKIIKNGSPLFCLDMFLRYGRILKGIQQPQLDDFSTACAVDTIKRKNPALLLLHLIDVDDSKHVYGTKSVEVAQAIKRMDKRLGDIIKAVKDGGSAEETAIMVVGDHGQLDISKIVKLNLLLKEEGLIEKRQNKYTWRAYFQSANGSAYLRVKPGDQKNLAQAKAVLKKAARNEVYGIEQVFDRKELDGFHADPSAIYMVEAKKGFSFSEEMGEPMITDLDAAGIHNAAHGYSPDKEGYRCNFVLSGSGIKKNHRTTPMDMVDIAPTVAALFGLEMRNTDGCVLTDIFE